MSLLICSTLLLFELKFRDIGTLSFIIFSIRIQNRALKILTVIRQTAFIACQVENVANLILNIATQSFVEKEMGIAMLQTNVLQVWFVEKTTSLIFIPF